MKRFPKDIHPAAQIAFFVFLFFAAIGLTYLAEIVVNAIGGSMWAILDFIFK